MLLLIFSYFLVKPSFVDFICCFGRQEQAKDLYFSAFESKVSGICSIPSSLNVPGLGWSGTELQLCYLLKSVECSQTPSSWSIRQAAIHHTFDLTKVRCSWIVLKGNKKLGDRIRNVTAHTNDLSTQIGSVKSNFGAALKIHLLICTFALENWPDYIRYLEEKLDRLTKEAMTKNADVPVIPKAGPEIIQSLVRRDTDRTQHSRRNRTFSFRRTPSGGIVQTTGAMPTLADLGSKESARPTFTTRTGLKQPLPPGMTKISPTDPIERREKRDNYGQREIMFSDLQDLHDLEETANEAALVLKLNKNVMIQLQTFYKSLFEGIQRDDQVLRDLQTQTESARANLQSQMARFEDSIDLYVLRAEFLLQKLTKRKSLVSQLTRSGRLLAHKYLVPSPPGFREHSNQPSASPRG